MAAAIVVYGSISAVAVAATATARKVVEEELTQVEFAPPPEPEPEPPPPEPEPVVQEKKPSPRPKVKRQELKPPDEVPLEKPKESDGPLAEAGEAGPVDGFLDGTPGGTGTAKPAPPPPPKPEPIVKPVGINTKQRPDYPKAALRRGIEGTVVVAFDVLENGTTANAKAVSGPSELQEAAVKMVLKWRFKPAKRGNVPIRHRMSQRVTFRLEDA